MKVGNRVVRITGGRHVYKIEKIRGNMAVVRHVVHGGYDNYRLTDLRLTSKNPVILVETLNNDWTSNVEDVLNYFNIRYITKATTTGGTRFFIDKKRLAMEKSVIEEFYRNKSLEQKVKSSSKKDENEELPF